MDYDYKEGKQRILDILNSKMEVNRVDNFPSDERDLTYSNGFKTGICSIFVDIRGSSNYFKEKSPTLVGKVIRCFCGEILRILEDDEKYKDIGIRGDCVYAIYPASKIEDLQVVLTKGIWIHTFQKMFQKILSSHSIETFKIGIGIGYGENDLVIKAGHKGKGINDYIWIGHAVIDACNLSSLGNSSNEFKTIVVSDLFYNEIIKNEKYLKYFTKAYSMEFDVNVWNSEYIIADFNNWINQGMK